MGQCGWNKMFQIVRIDSYSFYQPNIMILDYLRTSIGILLGVVAETARWDEDDER